jgi:hypothetical protein
VKEASRLSDWWFWLKYDARYTWPRDAWQWLANRLPRQLVLWALVRIAAAASMGEYGNTSPDELTYPLMYQRWEKE